MSKPPHSKKAPYTREQLCGAVHAVITQGESHMSSRAASIAFKVPRTTLRRHVSAISALPEAVRPTALSQISVALKVGASRPTALKPTLEQMLVTRLLELSEWGHPVTRRRFISKINAHFASDPECNPFGDKRPSRRWWYGLLRRHPAAAGGTLPSCCCFPGTDSTVGSLPTPPLPPSFELQLSTTVAGSGRGKLHRCRRTYSGSPSCSPSFVSNSDNLLPRFCRW